MIQCAKKGKKKILDILPSKNTQKSQVWLFRLILIKKQQNFKNQKKRKQKKFRRSPLGNASQACCTDLFTAHLSNVLAFERVFFFAKRHTTTGPARLFQRRRRWWWWYSRR